MLFAGSLFVQAVTVPLLCGVVAIALIVLVLRMLLAQAVARDVEAARMRAELAEVI
ncbi:hypothetical protein ALMP_80130 [Streptomyces sp. A012304]|nr:hypothetical protein ALMP_80130 [Streptomyces sp. A012304]